MEVRADTYLWAIRIYKSRTLASEAIKNGRVKLVGKNFKPSHLVKVGEVYSMTIGNEKIVLEVACLIEKRQSYEIAKKQYINHLPIIDKKEAQSSAFFVSIKRNKGSGRPTKKDRRDISNFEEV